MTTLSELETTVRSHANNEDVLDVVLLTSTSCTFCGPVKQVFDQINIEGVNLYTVDLEDLPPLFAYASIPSITIFWKGVKVFESMVTETITLEHLTTILSNIKGGAIPSAPIIQ